MHVELIVHLPGLYDDQLIFFPAWGLPQGNILPFSSIYSSPVWNDVPICSMCAWISAAEVHLNLTHTHTHADSHTWKWFQGLRGMWPSRHPSSDTEKQPLAHPPPSSASTPCPSTTHHLCVLFLGPPNASPDPYQSRGSTTCWSKSSIDLKQLCAVEHYILIRVAWWL